MLKKILLVGSALALTSSLAFANAAPYVGGGIGLTNNTANVKISGTTYTFGSYRGIPVNVFAGYGGVVSDSFYLAGELGGTITTANLSNNNGLRTTYGYSASIIPGVMLSDHTMAFARAGLIRTRFSSANDTRTGGQLGLGMQTSLTQNIDLRGEYDFVAYRSINTNVGGVGYSTSPRSDQFNVGIVYKFE